MIQEFYVSNFYSIKDRQVISFVPNNDASVLEQCTYEVASGTRLLKVGILYGANASGKSTLLQAIEFFRQMMSARPASKLEGIAFDPFLLDNHSRGEKSSMGMTFYVNGERYVLDVVFDGQRIYEEDLYVYVSARPSLLYKRRYDMQTDSSVVEFGTKIGLAKKSRAIIQGNTINNSSVLAALGQSNIESSRLTTVYDFFSQGMRPLLHPKVDMLGYAKDSLTKDTDDRLKTFLLQVLKASDFNIVDVDLEKKGEEDLSELVFRHNGEDGTFELKEVVESQGTKRFLGMSVMLYDLLEGNNFMSIDEVESSIHYELLAYFIKLFLINSQGESQLLMTTHDINLLNEDFIRRDVVWFTDKDESGATSVERLSSLGLHKTLSPYNAYRQGKLVKLPFLGSIYLQKN